MLLTANPGGIGHSWVKRIFIDKQFIDNERPEHFGFVQAKVYDNKALMDVDPDYVQRLEDLPEDSPLLAEIEFFDTTIVGMRPFEMGLQLKDAHKSFFDRYFHL